MIVVTSVFILDSMSVTKY